MTKTATIPRVYVGTYHKYASGSLAGGWLNLEDHDDRLDFMKAARDLHSDEPDAELMFQSVEGLPRGMVSECDIDEAAWEWLELCDDDRTMWDLYRDRVTDEGGTLDEARESFLGVFADSAGWAEDDTTSMLDDVPEPLRNHIDYESYVVDAECRGIMFIWADGRTWVFDRTV